MPALHFWFTGTALYLFGSFAFAIAVGLIGVKDMIPRWALYVFLLAALVLSGLAWRTAAKQESDSSEQETRATDLGKTVTELTKGISNVSKQNDSLLSTLNQIASVAKVDTNLPTQSLADKIIERISSLDNRLNKVENPPREQNQLYIGNKSIAVVLGIDPDAVTNTVVLKRVSSQNPLDFSQRYYLQKAILKCDPKENSGFSMSGAVISYLYYDISCKIVGAAP